MCELFLAIREREGSAVRLFWISQNIVERLTIMAPINVGLSVYFPHS